MTGWSLLRYREAKERGEPIPAEVEAVAKHARRRIREMGPEFALLAGRIRAAVERMAAWRDGGGAEADWLTMWLSDDDAEALQALGRIVGRVGRPISRRRWNTARADLTRACEDLGVTVRDLARGPAGWQAVQEFAEAVRLGERPDDARLLQALRGPLERLVCEELLGVGFRRDYRGGGPREVALSEELLAKTDAAAAAELQSARETSAMIEIALDEAGLTAGERAVLDLDLRGWTTGEIASRLDTTPAAIRRRRSDGMKKLKPPL